MPHDPDFCGRCKAAIYPDDEQCPNCGAWREAVLE